MATTPSDPGKYSHPGHASGAGSDVPGHPAKATTHLLVERTFLPRSERKFLERKPASQGVVNVATSWIAVTPDAEQRRPLPGRQIRPILPLNPCQTSQSTVLARAAAMPATGRPFFLAVGFHKPLISRFVAPWRFFNPLPDGEHQFAAGSRPAGWHAQNRMVKLGRTSRLPRYCGFRKLWAARRPPACECYGSSPSGTMLLDVDRLQHWAASSQLWSSTATLTTQ